MVKSKNGMTLDQMEEIAREATRVALSRHPKPEGLDTSTLSILKTEAEGKGIFEIYVPAGTPSEARVLSRATVDRFTGEVVVEVMI